MNNSIPQISAMAIELPEVHGHPNRIPFEGCLSLVDTPSDTVPSGARGHRVLLTRDAAEKAMPSLLGMAVNYKKSWDGHDYQRKCGIITSAYMEGKSLMVGGFLYGRDFPEVIVKLQDSKTIMGMSYELAGAHVEDMRQSVWVITKVTFTGAAIILRNKAAYKNTSFCLTSGANTPPKNNSIDLFDLLAK
jgi:hypothetical protein